MAPICYKYCVHVGLTAQRSPFAIGCALILWALCSAGVAGERVSVTVSSGRTFTGEVDRRTDAVSLWLRSGRGTSEILRPIDWYAVRGVRAGERTLSTSQFREEINRWKSIASPNEPIKPTAKPAKNEVEELPAPSPVPPAVIPQARSVQIDAQVANWDGDVEMDGLLISVYPIDGQGQAVPVDGTLEVELIGEGPGTVVQRQTFPTIGRWVRRVSHDDFGPQGNVFQLPFQAVQPEFDLKYGAVGLVHARLVVPGQGAFETTSNATTLRPYNPVRDRLQSLDDQRFFPTERTGHGKQRVPQMGGI